MSQEYLDFSFGSLNATPFFEWAEKHLSVFEAYGITERGLLAAKLITRKDDYADSVVTDFGLLPNELGVKNNGVWAGLLTNRYLQRELELERKHDVALDLCIMRPNAFIRLDGIDNIFATSYEPLDTLPLKTLKSRRLIEILK